MERRFSDTEFRAEGRRLSGIAMKYGDISPGHRERFEPKSLRLADTVHLDLFHDVEKVIAWHPGGGLKLTNTRDALSLVAELPPIPAANRALDEVRSKMVGGLSVEFKEVTDRRENGIRIIESALLTGVGIVRAPSYGQSGVEARRKSGRTLRARIPAGETVACECSQDSRWAKVIQPLMDQMWKESFEEGTKAVVGAYLENYGTPIASTARGTLRGRITGAGGHEVDIDLPDSEAGRSLLAAWEDSGIIARPFIADQQSTLIDGVREITAGRLRALIITSTDAREGWPEPTMLPLPDEQADANAPRKRRLKSWL